MLLLKGHSVSGGVVGTVGVEGSAGFSGFSGTDGNSVSEEEDVSLLDGTEDSSEEPDGSEVVVSSELSFSLTVPPLDDGFCETEEDELGFEEETEDEVAAEEEVLPDEEPP